mgnify:FL=1
MSANRRQGGFSSILLIAIVVLLASLSAFALNFLRTGAGAQSSEILALRAEQAAKAALEWQRRRVAGGTCTATQTFNVPLAAGNFPATLTCTQTSPGAGYTEGASTIRTYQLGVTACWPATGGSCPVAIAAQSPDYVQRALTGTAVCNITTGRCSWPR